jgi:3-carboxy-cis,cis-muconate cycloisomerase
MSEDLFGPLFFPDEIREAVGGRAWLQAMLDAEAALAVAEARADLIPAGEAEAIADCCDADLFDLEEIGREGRAAGNPVPPLVKALTEAVPGDAARHVHKGATSQDIMDTAAMVQQALPTTFGLKAAGWLVAVLEARNRLLATRDSGLYAQLGGAAGTLASLGPRGIRGLQEFAQELNLTEPVVPWHTARLRIAELGNVLALASGVMQSWRATWSCWPRPRSARWRSLRKVDAAALPPYRTSATQWVRSSQAPAPTGSPRSPRRCRLRWPKSTSTPWEPGTRSGRPSAMCWP